MSLEYYLSLKEFFEKEEAKILTETKEVLAQLKLTVVGFKLRWDIESHLENIKKNIDMFKQKFLEEETRNFWDIINENTKTKLKELVHIDTIETEGSLWEELQTTFGSIVKGNAEILSEFLQGNTFQNKKNSK